MTVGTVFYTRALGSPLINLYLQSLFAFVIFLCLYVAFLTLHNFSVPERRANKVQILKKKKEKHVSPRVNMDLSTLNALPYEDFVQIFGNVVEKCPIITAAVWSSRPFAGVSALEAAINEFIDALPESGGTQVLRLLSAC